MLIDNTLVLDNRAALTATRQSTNIIDLGANRDIGIGDNDLYVVVKATTALVGPSNATVAVEFQTSADGVTFSTILTSAPVSPAVFNAQGALRIEVPAGVQRFIALEYDVANGPLTAGTVFATITTGRDANVYLPRNYVA